MSENNQMMSVEGQLVGMPLAGPESFSQQQLNYLKRALGVDETVLYVGAKVATVNTEFAISEPLSNFELIQVWAARTPESNSYDVCTIAPTGTYINVHTSWVQPDGNQLNLYEAKLTVGTNKLTVVRQICKALTDSQHNTTTASPLTIYKVVGIHRIAGGNQ